MLLITFQFRGFVFGFKERLSRDIVSKRTSSTQLRFLVNLIPIRSLFFTLSPSPSYSTWLRFGSFKLPTTPTFILTPSIFVSFFLTFSPNILPVPVVQSHICHNPFYSHLSLPLCLSASHNLYSLRSFCLYHLLPALFCFSVASYHHLPASLFIFCPPDGSSLLVRTIERGIEVEYVLTFLQEEKVLGVCLYYARLFWVYTGETSFACCSTKFYGKNPWMGQAVTCTNHLTSPHSRWDTFHGDTLCH